ncbi:MAG TPA: molybdopterin-binding protein [Xanthobacteraceae bacterium]|nr:molybdopterin-binding protein [Xanthobacteraceae bacterium]
MVVDSSIQRIARLTPLRDVLALVESRVGAVKPRPCRLASALGRMLADDVVAAERPPQPIALRDGFAVEAAAIADAGPYTPVPFASMPCRVDAGAPLPCGTNAVVPLDAVTLRGDRAEAVAAVSPGEGVLPAGGDAMPHTALRRAGERLRAKDIAVIAAAGIADVTIREPRIRIACGCGSVARTPLIEAALAMLAHAVTVAGGTVLDVDRQAGGLDEALPDDRADAVIAIGGTGSGRHDASVQTLARLGRVEAHGIAVSPGESAAFGFVGARPVLLVPGRIDATLAIWLLIGRQLIARLVDGSVEDTPVMLPLKRKVASTIGLAELNPVGCSGGMAEPLASGYLSLGSLARSDGWIVVAAESEGFAAGTLVAVRSWP